MSFFKSGTVGWDTFHYSSNQTPRSSCAVEGRPRLPSTDLHVFTLSSDQLCFAYQLTWHPCYLFSLFSNKQSEINGAMTPNTEPLTSWSCRNLRSEKNNTMRAPPRFHSSPLWTPDSYFYFPKCARHLHWVNVPNYGCIHPLGRASASPLGKVQFCKAWLYRSGGSGWESNLEKTNVINGIKEPVPRPRGISCQAWMTPQRRSPVRSAHLLLKPWGEPMGTRQLDPSRKPSLKLPELCDIWFSFGPCLDFHPTHKFPILHFPHFEKMRMVMLTTAPNT